MVHHWRASDNLEHSFTPGEWVLYDRGTIVGYIHYGRVNGHPALRGSAPDGSVLGYAESLEDACDRMWAWHRRAQ